MSEVHNTITFSSKIARSRLFILMLLLFFSMSLVAAGYLLGAKERRIVTIDQDYASKLLSSHQKLTANFVDIQQKTAEQLSSLKARMGKLEAYMLKLDALELEIAKEAGVDVSEFTLAEAGIGGPMDQTPDLMVEYNDSILLDIMALEKRLLQQQKSVDVLSDILMDRSFRLNSQISGPPVENGWLSSPYGLRHDPFNGKKTWHKGVDFAGPVGKPIIATGPGIVTWASKRTGYGFLVEVDHGNGLVTRYAHCKSLKVKVGEKVEKGQHIATIGLTGRSTGPHVHYEVLKNGNQINPYLYLTEQ